MVVMMQAPWRSTLPRTALRAQLWVLRAAAPLVLLLQHAASRQQAVVSKQALESTRCGWVALASVAVQ